MAKYVGILIMLIVSTYFFRILYGGLSMKQRPIDRSKKSNIKCEHCSHWSGWLSEKCKLSGDVKQYYQRCKNFNWSTRLKYKED